MNESIITTDKIKRLTGTRRKKCSLNTYLSECVLSSYWDGGSCSKYSVVNVLNGLHTNPPVHGGQFDRSEKRKYVPAPGDVLITTGTFCGKPSYPSFSCREEDLTAVKQFLGIV